MIAKLTQQTARATKPSRPLTIVAAPPTNRPDHHSHDASADAGQTTQRPTVSDRAADDARCPRPTRADHHRPSAGVLGRPPPVVGDWWPTHAPVLQPPGPAGHGGRGRRQGWACPAGRSRPPGAGSPSTPAWKRSRPGADVVTEGRGAVADGDDDGGADGVRRVGPRPSVRRRGAALRRRVNVLVPDRDGTRPARAPGPGRRRVSVRPPTTGTPAWPCRRVGWRPTARPTASTRSRRARRGRSRRWPSSTCVA